MRPMLLANQPAILFKICILFQIFELNLNVFWLFQLITWSWWKVVLTIPTRFSTGAQIMLSECIHKPLNKKSLIPSVRRSFSDFKSQWFKILYFLILRLKCTLEFFSLEQLFKNFIWVSHQVKSQLKVFPLWCKWNAFFVFDDQCSRFACDQEL